MFFKAKIKKKSSLEMRLSKLSLTKPFFGIKTHTAKILWNTVHATDLDFLLFGFLIRLSRHSEMLGAVCAHVVVLKDPIL